MRFTILDAEEALAHDVALWVQDYRLKSPVDRGVTPVPFEVVQGYLQSYQAGPQVAMQNKAPAISVRISHGTFHRVQPRESSIALEIVVLTWDDDLTRQGYRDVANVMQAITTAIYEKRMISKSFPVTDDPVTWALVEDPARDFFPYFAGVIQVKLGIGIPEPNDASYILTGSQTITLRTKMPIAEPVDSE